MPPQPPADHRWYTPSDCAALLGAVKRGQGYRGPCPVHGGDNPDALHIWQTTDPRGNPVTQIYCHTRKCDIRDICIHLGIELHNLYSIRPEHNEAMKHFPRAHSSDIARLKTMQEPSPDEIAQIMLVEFIVNDPVFLDECPPARETFWRLFQEPKRQPTLVKALRRGGYSVKETLKRLRQECGQEPAKSSVWDKPSPEGPSLWR